MPVFGGSCWGLVAVLKVGARDSFGLTDVLLLGWSILVWYSWNAALSAAAIVGR